jgi:membrane-associated phospholipid phosphatase
MRSLFAIVIALVLSFVNNTCQAQVYEFKRPLDISLGVITIGGGSASYFLKRKKEPLTETQINSLNIMDINRFDRSAAQRTWNSKINLSSDIGMVFSIATPALLLIDPKMRSEAKVIIPMWMETFGTTMALTGLTKELVRRARPYVYNPDAPFDKKIERDATSSFFSGHTSMSAANAFFAAKVYADLNPDSHWKPAVWTGAAILPLTVGLLRYSGGKHFFTDILTGYLVGTAVGILVPHLHRVGTK